MSLDDGRRSAEQGIYPGYVQAAREGLAHIVSVVNGYPNGVPFDPWMGTFSTGPAPAGYLSSTPMTAWAN